MTKPLVAIVGRPNVGKSSLLNRIAGKKIAITEDMPGTTRDRIFADSQWSDRQFTLVDTGGLVPNAQDEIAQAANSQVIAAINDSDIIIFIVDIKTGLTPIDKELAQIVRRSDKPIVLVANKADNTALEMHANEFYALGLGDPISISAYHGLGIYDVLDAVYQKLPATATEENYNNTDNTAIRLAIAGRANVGKSTILNALVGQERSVVSNIPGTTRDSIDTAFSQNEQKYVIIDTAGIRRRGKIEKGIERYSVYSSLRAVKSADIVLLVMDATEVGTAQDIHLAGLVEEEKKGVIVVITKCDLVFDLDRNRFSETIRQKLRFMPYVPVMFVSGKTGFNLKNILPMVKEIYLERQKRFATKTVNSTLSRITTEQMPPREGRRQLKILYSTQVGINPPIFVMFVNDKSLIHFSYDRFLQNRLREEFGFRYSPISLIYKNRGESKEPEEKI